MKQGGIVLLCTIATIAVFPTLWHEDVRGAFPPGKHVDFMWIVRSLALLVAASTVLGDARWNRVAAFLLVLFLLILPAVGEIAARKNSAPHKHCHDSVIQIEAASGMLLSGKDPYERQYRETPLYSWKGYHKNPALDHFVYPPLILFFSSPLKAVFGDFYDQRFLYILLLLITAPLLWRLLRGNENRLALFAVILFNPWFSRWFVEGRNDIFVLVWVVSAFLAIRSGHRGEGLLLLGFSIAAKTYMLVLIPVVLLAGERDWKKMVRMVLLLAGPLLLTSIPFLIWHPGAFLEDTLLAPSGLGVNPFEARGYGGYGFATWLLYLGLISPDTAFPFVLFQLAAAGGICWLAWKRGVKGEGEVLLWSAALLFSVLFFGRFLHDNYVGFAFLLGVLGWALREARPDPEGDPVPLPPA